MENEKDGELLSYSVTLNSQVVEESKELIKSTGGKLSPILNNLLKKWVEMNKVNSENKE
ncbi:hypothetical protein LCGC14_2579850 [marine sediment metagenome]|uniref:Uncharacterized protein n=1 Tax=marine sediment metagenome TaxID=412755 RepID=A0A0F8W0J9_9ZZZZ